MEVSFKFLQSSYYRAAIRHTYKIIPIFFFLFIAFIILLTCSIFLHLNNKTNLSFPSIWPDKEVTLSLLLVYLLGAFARSISTKGWRESYDPFVKTIKEPSFYIFFIFTFILLLFILNITSIPTDFPEKKISAKILYLVINEPGGLFTVFVGFATLLGLTLTIQGLWGIRRTINSFAELIDRICIIAKEATEKSPLHIVSYTPAIGYIAQPEYDWFKLSEIIRKRVNGKPIVKIVCLNDRDLKIWHNLFVDRDTLRGKIDLTITTQATNESEDHLADIEKASSGLVIRLPQNYMPGFYTFFTRNKAIIVTPLFFPFPKGAPKEKQQYLPTVQMIGMETSDKGIIKDLQQMYKYYSELPKSLLGEADCIIKKTEIESWCANINNAKDKIENLLGTLLTSYNMSKDLPPYKSMLDDGDVDIELELYANIKTW